jgi:uncharacterized membrane protein YgcG
MNADWANVVIAFIGLIVSILSFVKSTRAEKQVIRLKQQIEFFSINAKNNFGGTGGSGGISGSGGGGGGGAGAPGGSGGDFHNHS